MNRGSVCLTVVCNYANSKFSCGLEALICSVSGLSKTVNDLEPCGSLFTSPSYVSDPFPPEPNPRHLPTSSGTPSDPSRKLTQNHSAIAGDTCLWSAFASSTWRHLWHV